VELPIVNEDIEPTVIYPSLKDAEAAVCQMWCEQEGYSDRFYFEGSWWAFPPNAVLPVRIHEVINLEDTPARRVLVQHYSLALSIALLPDGCIAPHDHPEIHGTYLSSASGDSPSLSIVRLK
jgi:hypothetical protein